jgi:hypothetical protein
VHAGLSEPIRPLDVVLFIEARLDFDDRGDLFAAFTRLNQRLRDRRILAGAIKADFYGDNLRVARAV